ncbi:MAG: threonylcarbamoyl-AMP synthase [Gammaproteobacteria bacterium]|nr:threonylcarbamoyl-AMP synthase [Gammaproteobacteria bacterium]
MFVLEATGPAISQAVERLQRGEFVGLPTETVYGLAADAGNDLAVARIYAAKGRPTFNPLIAHVSSLDMAMLEAVLDERAQRLVARFWPGPLTLVLPLAGSHRVCELARAGLQSVALRMPGHPVALELIRAFGGPLAAPSANRSGRISPTTAQDVVAELGDQPGLVLDAGPARVGLESTIVAVLPGEPVRLLRPGGVSREALQGVVGELAVSPAERIEAPGQLASHYAPHARLRMNALTPEPGEAFLGFGLHHREGSPNLSRAGDLVEAAANLFTMLRRLDASGVAAIAVAPVPEHGLGEAINDRLRRAAAPR